MQNNLRFQLFGRRNNLLKVFRQIKFLHDNLIQLKLRLQEKEKKGINKDLD